MTKEIRNARQCKSRSMTETVMKELDSLEFMEYKIFKNKE